MVFCLLILGVAHAKIRVEDAYIRLTPPGSKTSAGYLTLKNTSNKAVELIKAETDFAGTTELHTHGLVEGVMKMRQVSKMKIGPQKILTLKPHGDHLMFFEISSELEEGARKKVTLTFSDGQKVEVPFVVKDLKKKKHQH